MGSRASEKMGADRVAKQRSYKPTGGEDIWKLREEVGDTLGAEWRVARREEDNGGEKVNVMAGEPGKQLVGHVQEKIMMKKENLPRIKTETGASWKGHLKLQVPKRRGIILEPKQEKEDPSAVKV